MKKSALLLSIESCLILAGGLLQAQFNPGDPSSGSLPRAGEFPINEELIQLAAPYSQSYPSVAFDGNIYMVVWVDYRDQETDIYGARMDINGNLIDPAGLIICNAPESQTNPVVATNGEIFFVVWREERNDESDDDIYGARVTPEGVILDPDGIPICTAIDDQDDPAVACVGSDFCVTWSDYRKENDQDIYANFVSNTGIVSHVNGLPVCTSSSYQSYSDVCADGSRYFIVWVDDRNSDNDIYGSFLETDGTVIPPDGAAIAVLPDSQRYPAIYHGGGQYFMAWEDDSYETFEMIRGSRIDMDGTLLDPNGISISTYPDLYCVMPDVNYDGNNFWIAYAKGIYGTNYNFDILVCRINAGGQVLDPQGITVVATGDREEKPALAFDGQQMLICRQEVRSSMDIYGSFADLQGNISPAEGILISPGFNNQISGKIGFDGTHYMAIWLDSRNDNSSDLYAARVDQSGNVLDHEALPIITGEGGCFSPAICFNGTHYLIVWEKSVSDLFGARVTADGQVMAPGEFVIYQGNYSQAKPAIASDGTNWMVVWEDDRNSSGANFHSDLYGTLVSPDGVVLHPEGLPIIAYQTDQQNCSMVYDGTNYILVWEDYRAGFFGEPAIYGARLTPDGTVLDPNGIALAVNEERPMENPIVAYSANTLMTCFTEFDYYENTSEVKFVRFTHDMSLLDNEPMGVNLSSTIQYNPLVTNYSDKFLVTWIDNTDAFLNHIEMAVISTSGVISETGIFAEIGKKMKLPAMATGPADQVLSLFSSFIRTAGSDTINALRLYGKRYGEGTGWMEPMAENNLVIWPNPTQGKFQITNTKFQTNSKFQNQNNKIEIVDLFGKAVEFHNNRTIEVDIRHLPAGVYFVRINLENQMMVKEIIKL